MHIHHPEGRLTPEQAIAAMVAAFEVINRLTSPGNRTFDEMIRDMGHACDMARTGLRLAARVEAA